MRSSAGDELAGSEIISGTISILEALYGRDSHKCKVYLEQHKNWIQKNDMEYPNLTTLVLYAVGVLKSIKSEIELGLVGNIQLQAQGGIFGDFITLARESLNDSKDVAAVLVSAALEDTLKKFALHNGLDVDDKDMSQVIKALKSQGSLIGPQASLVKSYVQLRNKAFHAEWDKIEKETVNSAISFIETFLLKHFR